MGARQARSSGGGAALPRSPVRALTPLQAAPADLRHLAAVREDATAAERRAAHGRIRGRGLAHPSARSLLFTILGEQVLPSDGQVWSSTLVAAMGALGIDERTARQAIARTAAAGWLTSQRVGRRVAWRLTAAARELLAQGADRIYRFGSGPEQWDGQWLLLRISLPEGRRLLHDKLRTQLAWASFGPLRQGLWLSPHVDRESEAIRVIENLGLGADATSFLVRRGALGDDRKLAREAWGLSTLSERYRTFLAEFESLHPATAEATFAAHTRLVHEWRLLPFIDPGLPAALLPESWVGHRARRTFVECRTGWGLVAARWFQQQSEPA